MNNVIPPFVVTCVGAYNDSGIGTGGFVLIDSGNQATIIDRYDSTGMDYKENRLFRYVRTLNKVAIYDKQGLLGTLKLSNSNDIHDLKFIDNKLVAVSTGSNEILWYDLKGELVKSYKESGEGDATHINCIYKNQDEYFVSLFGDFDKHREWKNKARGKGFVKKLSSGATLFNNLSGPHNPMFDSKFWYVCNSWENTLQVRESDSFELIEEIDLGGFTRGLTYDLNNIYVGVNADRKGEESKHAEIVVLGRHDFNILKRVTIPFPEVYDIIILDNEWEKSMKNNSDSFQIEIQSQVIESIQKQVEIGEQKVVELKGKIEKLKIRNQLLEKLKSFLRISK